MRNYACKSSIRIGSFRHEPKKHTCESSKFSTFTSVLFSLVLLTNHQSSRMETLLKENPSIHIMIAMYQCINLQWWSEVRPMQTFSDENCKPWNNHRTSPMKECTFWKVLKVGNYTESTVLHTWCPMVISSLELTLRCDISHLHNHEGEEI